MVPVDFDILHDADIAILLRSTWEGLSGDLENVSSRRGHLKAANCTAAVNKLFIGPRDP